MNKICLICGAPALGLPFGYDEEEELCIMLKLKMAEVIAQLIKCGVNNFICNCEYGIPMWDAEIVLAQKLFTPNISLEIYTARRTSDKVDAELAGALFFDTRKG